MEVQIVNKNGNHLCVLGCVDNEKGKEIAKKMLVWITRAGYCVHVVHHDGSLYEYPALHYLQELCAKTGKSCLYIHTRGAFHRWKTTRPTHIMWEHEFGDLQEVYFQLVNTDYPAAACPFTGPGKHTFYNGFVVNAAAMSALPEITPKDDRMEFEYIFKGSNVKVFGTKFNDLDYPTLGAARQYLYKLYL